MNGPWEEIDAIPLGTAPEYTLLLWRHEDWHDVYRVRYRCKACGRHQVFKTGVEVAAFARVHTREHRLVQLSIRWPERW